MATNKATNKATKKDLTKDDLVKKEIRRIKRIYKDLPKDILQVVEGLIVQAARHRVDLDEMWEDMKINGKVELFSQSDKTDPYERERPVVRQYYTTDKLFQTIMKQLGEYKPKVEPKKEEGDGFEDFVNER